MSFSVDQFMQVKCSFQLTSESDSSESIHTNKEEIRLCKSVNLDTNQSALIVMVCTNDTGNNHILAYHIERRQHNHSKVTPQQQQVLSWSTQKAAGSILASTSIEQSQSVISDDNSPTGKPGSVTSANQLRESSPIKDDSAISCPSKPAKRVKTKPRIIVKQIYYHDYNEDIVAICLNKLGTKLVLVNASSTVYIIPIKNILFNLHAQQLRSSQGRSMYFYDASILYCVDQTFSDPVDAAYWDSPETQKATIILASHSGKLIFISVEEKRVIASTSVGEAIKSIKIVRDKYSYSLLITCESLNQYRQKLEMHSAAGHKPSQRQQQQQQQQQDRSVIQAVISLPPSKRTRSASRGQKQSSDAAAAEEHAAHLTPPSWSAKPLPIRPLTSSAGQYGASLAANALQRVLLPSAGRFGSQSSLMASGSFNDVRERPLSMVGYQAPNLISLVDVLGPNSAAHMPAGANRVGGEPRLLRFYSDKQYFYQAQRPQVILKLDLQDPDELITDLILTDRFVALTTNRDRCIVNSRNCSKLKSPLGAQPDLNPLIKEITFNHEEKIMLLIKSPALNDPDQIIDSFLLVTTRSIYTIEARHGCRELYIDLIDSHLAIKRTLFMARPRPEHTDRGSFSLGRMISSASEEYILEQRHESSRAGRLSKGTYTGSYAPETRNAESNLLINSFLQHRDAYERVCHDSLAFSTLFKVELASLYEAYADRLLQRGQLELANRFFQMASFDHIKILGKYIRIGAHRETIEYVKALLEDDTDFRRVLGESERIELSKIAFEFLLAKTKVERSKLCLFQITASSSYRSRLSKVLRERRQVWGSNGKQQQQHIVQEPTWISPAGQLGPDPFGLCEHSPRGQDAKLSATTIVPSSNCLDDENTLTNKFDSMDLIAQRNNNNSAKRPSRLVGLGGLACERARLECERSLIDFIRYLMPSSMFEYTIDQLLDFDLIEFIDLITQTDLQILTFIKMVIRYRDEDRLVFRASKACEPLVDRLIRLNQAGLIKVSIEKEEFLEFLTSHRVTRALVNDIGLMCEYYGYKHSSLVQFRKYSFAATHHLESYRQLVRARNDRRRRARAPSETEAPLPTSHRDDDDNANDGLSFARKFEHKNDKQIDMEDMSFDPQQKRHVEMIFIEFLTACLDVSAEDSCRLWDSYVNFYLNFVGSLRELQSDIVRLLEDTGDCRISVSLYRAIHRDEQPIKSADTRQRNKVNLFDNEFLMKLLSNTLAIQNSR